MRPHSGPFLSILYGGSLGSVSSLIVLGPLDHFLRLLYGAPQICFFSYNMGAPLRSVSLFTIWDPPPPSDQFLCMLYGVPSEQFCAYFLGAPLRSVFSLTICGPSQISFFSYYMGPPQISFFAYYMGGGLLRSVPSPTIGGSPEISFIAYYMRAPLRSVSSPTIWGPH